jgi:uncharacterized protein (DUF305 family)
VAWRAGRPRTIRLVPLRRLGLLLIAATAAASLTSCNSADSPFGALGGVRHAPNAADVGFLRSMTEQEKVALGITRLAQHRALRKELRGIARTMTTEQQDDLRALGRLAQGLPRRAASPPSRSPTFDLARVKDASSFDYEFMRTMIERTQAAIAIADHETSFGSDAEVKRLAGAIGSSRRKELAQLRAWLHLWYGGEIQPGAPPPGQPIPAPGSPDNGPPPL